MTARLRIKTYVTDEIRLLYILDTYQDPNGVMAIVEDVRTLERFNIRANDLLECVREVESA